MIFTGQLSIVSIDTITTRGGHLVEAPPRRSCLAISDQSLSFVETRRFLREVAEGR